MSGIKFLWEDSLAEYNGMTETQKQNVYIH